MVEETDVVDFLKEHDGQASLDEVSEALGIPKYGPESAYAVLQSLRMKGVVDRRGEMWALISPEKVVSETRHLPPTSEKAVSEEAPTLEMEKLVQAVAKTLAEAVKTTRMPTDEWELATKPMKTKIERKEKKLSAFVLRPDEAVKAEKPLLGLPTGTFLDSLFLTPDGEPLKGIPICGQFAIVGLPGAGKSILVEEIAMKVSASGRKVLYATAEQFATIFSCWTLLRILS